MKQILFFLTIMILTNNALATIMKQVAHPKTLESLRLQTIERELGISRTDWKYELQDNESLDVIWYSVDPDEDQIIGQWTFDKKSNSPHILSLIFVNPTGEIGEFTTRKITFASITTSYITFSEPNISFSRLICEELENLKKGGIPLKLWSLETNQGSGLKPAMYTTVQLKTESNHH